MTLAEIKTLLENITDFQNKVVYYAWPTGEAPALPFICYYEDSTNNFAADGIVYQPIRNITIELYSKHKDRASESAIESALTNAGIFYDKTEAYLDDERCFMESYEIEV